ncbi:MAG: glycosyltransferase [Verrucomicrobiae bacterium]|nr:glycosyltransferase [Verrucomicrobiae bacterium]
MKLVFLNSAHIDVGGLSGGETIILNLFREWRKIPDVRITVLTDTMGRETWRRHGVECPEVLDVVPSCENDSVFRRYLWRPWRLIRSARVRELMRDADAVYSASDFWQDSLPAFYFKRKYPKLRWIAGFYLFAPVPFSRESPYRGRHFFRGLFYWLMQRPVYWIVRRWADVVYVTSEPDVKRFAPKPVVVVRGGVDTSESEAYLNSRNVIPVEQRKYDAVFMGRLHYQKGALLLVDIWREVVRRRPGAKLAVIGHGPLEPEMRAKIREYGLEGNIQMLGFLSGQPKYEGFKQSKVVLHPATYDSGGMAAAEAMAWGLPGVSFDLEALRTYYPRGMVRVSAVGDVKGFADEVLRLLQDEAHYAHQRAEALALGRESW